MNQSPQNMEKEIEELLKEASYDLDDEDFNPNREPVVAFSDALKVAKAAHSLGEQAMLEEVLDIAECMGMRAGTEEAKGFNAAVKEMRHQLKALTPTT